MLGRMTSDGGEHRRHIDERLSSVLGACEPERDIVGSVMDRIAGRTPSQVVRDRAMGTVRLTCGAAAGILCILIVWAGSLGDSVPLSQKTLVVGSSVGAEGVGSGEIEPIFEAYFEDPLGGADVTLATAMDSLLFGDLIQ